jgi:hypothetical protein
MMTASELADAIGRKKLVAALPVGATAVSNAVVRGRFPSSWFLVACRLAEEAGVECDPALFGMHTLDTHNVDNLPEEQGEQTRNIKKNHEIYVNGCPGSDASAGAVND